MGALALGILLMAWSPQSREEALALATETLAREKGMDPSEIQVRRDAEVEWPDASLGCPREGMMYAQVITPGYRVWLQARGEIHEVHVGDGRAVVCGPPSFQERGGMTAEPPIEAEEEPALPLPEAPTLRKLVDEARADLARRLNVEPDAIDLLEAKEVVWRDASLGCPKPGRLYPQSTREGFLIRLRTGKRVYRYHGGAGGSPFLCENPEKS